MLSSHEPQPPPGGEDEDEPAIGSILCPHCAASNAEAADFCVRCGAPLSVIASTDPLRGTLSEGFLYREATNGAPKRIVVVGIWLLFLPGLASLPFAWGSGETDPHRLATQGFWSLLSAVIPVLTTVNFVRKRRRTPEGLPRVVPNPPAYEGEILPFAPARQSRYASILLVILSAGPQARSRRTFRRRRQTSPGNSSVKPPRHAWLPPAGRSFGSGPAALRSG